MNRKAIEKKWRTEGFSCLTWIDPPGEHWNHLVHAVDHRLFVVDGCLELRVGEDIRCLNAGDEVVVPAGTSHSIRNSGTSMVRWLYGLRYNH